MQMHFAEVITFTSLMHATPMTEGLNGLLLTAIDRKEKYKDKGGRGQ